MNKLLTSILGVLVPVFLFAATNVVPKVEYTKGFIENIRSNDTLVNASGVPYSSGGAASWGAISGTLSSQSDLNTQLTNRYTKSDIGSTNLGTEGITLIGAQGGYKLSNFIQDTTIRGATRDLPVFSYSNGVSSVVSWTAGDIYDPNTGYHHLAAGTNTLQNFANNYAYWSSSSPSVVSWTTGNRAPVSTTIFLAQFSVSFGVVVNATLTSSAGDIPLIVSDAHSYVIPSLIVNGCLHSALSTNLNSIIMTPGIEFHDMTRQFIHNAQNLASNSITSALVMAYHTNSATYGFSYTNQFPIGVWDNGTNLVAITGTNWYRGLFLDNAGSPTIIYIPPQASYTSYTAAVSAADPNPPAGLDPYIPRCTAYIFQGGDTGLRTDSQYWIDDRFMIRRGTPVVSSGGSVSTPSLFQVLTAGNSTGGILPSGMGAPSSSDQAANKGYVDGAVNNVSSERAFVDPKGNDATAQLNSSILPYRNIQSAINACIPAATGSIRYVVTVSPGSYTENLTMHNGIAVRGTAVEETILNGVITYPVGYTDYNITEVGQMTIISSNSPTIIFNGGSDQAAMGVRSCIMVPFYYSNYTNQYMSVIRVNRGIVNLFPGCNIGYVNNGTATTNGYETIMEHTDDPSNPGLSTFTGQGIAGFFITSNPYDDVSEILTHDNTDATCINTLQDCTINLYLNTPGVAYSNNVKMVEQVRAIGRCLLMTDFTRLAMNATNGINLHMGYADHGTGDNVAIIRNNHIRISSGSSSNIWFGAAITTNDNLRIYDTEIIQANAFNYYPQRYTNAGSAGNYYINTPHQNGDQLFGSAVDFSTVNTIGTPVLPTTGHVKLTCYNYYPGIEDLYATDSSGNNIRIGRDSVFNGMNAEATTLQVGECVYITNGTSYASTPIIARCDITNTNKLPCAGIVVQVGGIASNGIGRIMSIGRTETTFDTSKFNAGDKLYVGINNGSCFPTNVILSAPYVSQQMGWVHTASTNGKMTVCSWKPDTLGNQLPSYYASSSTVVSATNGIWTAVTNLNAANITINNLVLDATRGNSNLYTLVNIANTNYQAALNSYSNALSIAITNSDASTSNALWVAVTNLNAANIAINNVVLDATRGNTNLYILVTNAQATANIALTNYLATLNSYSNALNNQIINSTNGLWVAVTNLNTGTSNALQSGINVAMTNYVAADNISRTNYQASFISSTNLTITTSNALWVATTNLNTGTSNGLQSGINIANTNYQGALASASSANTNYANSVAVSATNYANSIAVSSTNYTGSISNNLYTTMTNLVTGTSNSLQSGINIANTNYQGPLSSAASSSTNYANTIAVSATNYTGSISNNLYTTMTNNDTSILAIANSATNWIAANSNKVNAAITNNQTGVTLTGTFISSAPRFKANIGAVNITYSSAGAPNPVPMTNAIYVQGGTSFYSNSISAWYPRASSGVIKFMGVLYMTMANNVQEKLDLYKNGSYYATMFDYDYGMGAGVSVSTPFNFVDTATPSTNDYWQLYYTVGNNRTAVSQGTNNWWCGEVVP